MIITKIKEIHPESNAAKNMGPNRKSAFFIIDSSNEGLKKCVIFICTNNIFVFLALPQLL